MRILGSLQGGELPEDVEDGRGLPLVQFMSAIR